MDDRDYFDSIWKHFVENPVRTMDELPQKSGHVFGDHSSGKRLVELGQAFDDIRLQAKAAAFGKRIQAGSMSIEVTQRSGRPDYSHFLSPSSLNACS